ncbi:tripartite tricarboxylate transporter substrate binding protein [Lentibacillus sp. N15]|uniref:Bug family tripartite tricarboxylate transporter substrate binding protein n=1 Tax=Lentibacillus songyuanensis TaxID=3136161 RepID=UPI0031BAFA98
MKRFKFLSMMILVLFVSILLAACGENSKKTTAEGEGANYPEKTLNWTVAFGPGGGNDLMSRTVVDILNKHDLYDGDIVVENKEGGSGAVGWSYVNQQKGNPYHISSTSGNFIATPLISNTDFNYESFTPVGLLARDEMLFLVGDDSEYKSIEDFVKAANSNTLTVGGMGSAGPDLVVTSLLESTAGIDLEYVPFQEEGQLLTALSSGSVDAIVSNPGEVLGQIEAGKMKPIAYSGDERNPAFDDVLTFKEAGYDFSFSFPRGVILPADVSDEVQEYWIDALKEVVETDEWQDYLETNTLTDDPIWGDEFEDYLEETNDTFKNALEEAGALK